jgi:hypothetical protein
MKLNVGLDWVGAKEYLSLFRKKERDYDRTQLQRTGWIRRSIQLCGFLICSSDS